MGAVLTIFFTILFFSFLLSFFDSLLESVSPAFVSLSIKEKKKFAPLLQNLTLNLQRPRSALRSLNILISIFGAMFLSWQTHDYSPEFPFLFFVFSVTLVSFVLSDIFSRALARNYWKLLIPFSVHFIQFFVFLSSPLLFFSESLNASPLARSVNIEQSRKEVIAAAELGVQEGTFKARESSIIKNLLMMNEIFISDIMTPRSVIFALDGNETVAEVDKKYRPIRFSRLPVYQDHLDNIVGMTHRYKILEKLSHDKHQTRIEELTSSISRLPETFSASQAIDFFIREKEHMALVIDEYGITTGLVTLEDTVETLLGVEIVDEFDSVEDMRKYALEQWQIRRQKMRSTP